MSREFDLSGVRVLVLTTGYYFRVDIVEIDEPCAHEIQFGGMCAECGKDMTEYVYTRKFLVWLVLTGR